MIHCCLYFIAPHRLKHIDLAFMRRLHKCGRAAHRRTPLHAAHRRTPPHTAAHRTCIHLRLRTARLRLRRR